MTQPPFSGHGVTQARRSQPPWQTTGPPLGEPEVTRPVARPAAAMAAEAAAPASRRHAPQRTPRRETRRAPRRESRVGVIYWAIMVCTLAAMALVWSSPQNVRWGADLFGAGLLLAAVARVTLPDRSAGMLMTRLRWTDAATLAAFGLGTLAVGLVLPPPS